MYGLCTICNSPVEENKMYCHDCQAELDAALAAMELQRQREADCCDERWMSGATLDQDYPRQYSAEREPIRQKVHKHTGGIRTRNGK